MRRNILLIDDDPSIHELIIFFLKPGGFTVRAVADGFAGIQELRSNPYDLLLLDISLPRMNGVAILRAVRAIKKLEKLPVIILTASNEKTDVFRSKKYSISDYILKPPNRDDLINRVERVLGFAEFRLRNNDHQGRGVIEIPIHVESISRNGMIVSSPLPVEKKFLLESVRVSLLQSLKIPQTRFFVAECRPIPGGGYEYFLPFVGLSRTDQEKLQRWILLRAMDGKSATAGASR